jgi:hypothetical protein
LHTIRSASTTHPCQESPSAFARSRDQFETMVGWLERAEANALPHCELETRLQVEGRELLRWLVQDHLDLRARGEVRQEVVGADKVARTRVEPEHTRGLTTIFGEVAVERLAYRARGVPNLYPADAVLNLPAEKHSHGLRRLAAIEAVRGSFDEVSSAITRASGVRASGSRVSRDRERPPCRHGTGSCEHDSCHLGGGLWEGVGSESDGFDIRGSMGSLCRRDVLELEGLGGQEDGVRSSGAPRRTVAGLDAAPAITDGRADRFASLRRTYVRSILEGLASPVERIRQGPGAAARTGHHPPPGPTTKPTAAGSGQPTDRRSNVAQCGSMAGLKSRKFCSTTS